MEIEGILKVEEKYDLLDKKIDGFQYWIYCRFEVWYLYVFLLKTGRLSETPAVGTMCDKLPTLLGDVVSLTKCALHKGSVLEKRYDVCFMDHERRQRIGNCYECIYTDFMTDFFPNSFTMERTYRHRHLQPAKTQNLMYIDAIEVKSNLYSLLNRRCKTSSYRKWKRVLTKELREPMKELGDFYGVDVDVEKICEIILKYYYIYKIKLPYFSKILRKYQPRMIVQVVGYNMDCMIMNELTHDSDVPTVELQHGTIGKEHLMYGFNNENGKKEIRQFAKNLFCFSDFFLKGTKLPQTKVWSIGYPFLERMKETYPPKQNKDSGITILFLSQLRYGKELAEIAGKCRSILKDVRIIYKLHPKEFAVWRELYPGLRLDGIEVVDNMDKNVYQCFAEADVQVGGNTTAIYEGLAYELPTFILDYEELGEARELYIEGVAQIFKDAEELVNLLNNNNTSEIAKKSNIWGEDAVSISVQCLKKILNGEEE